MAGDGGNCISRFNNSAESGRSELAGVALDDFDNPVLNDRGLVCDDDSPGMSASRALVACLVSLRRASYADSLESSITAGALPMLRNVLNGLVFLFGCCHSVAFDSFPALYLFNSRSVPSFKTNRTSSFEK